MFCIIQAILFCFLGDLELFVALGSSDMKGIQELENNYCFNLWLFWDFEKSFFEQVSVLNTVQKQMSSAPNSFYVTIYPTYSDTVALVSAPVSRSISQFVILIILASWKAKAYIKHVEEKINDSECVRVCVCACVRECVRVHACALYARVLSVNSDTCSYNYHNVLKMTRWESLAGHFIAGFNLWLVHISLLIW